MESKVEAATAPIEISVAKVFNTQKIYGSDWSRLVYTTAQQGSGSVKIRTGGNQKREGDQGDGNEYRFLVVSMPVLHVGNSLSGE